MATALPRPRPKRHTVRMAVPLLMPGDHLDRATFHARYLAMPEGTRAELVGGIVYITPLLTPHGEAHLEVMHWIGDYKAATPGVRAFDSVTIFLTDDGEPQPDASLILPPERGGQ